MATMPETAPAPTPDAPPEEALASPPPRSQGGRAEKAVLILFLLAGVGLTVLGQAKSLDRPFTYAWGGVGAHIAVAARSFADRSILELGGTPIQNNPPLGAKPDYYIDWPPVYYIVLGTAFRLFGSTETVAHAVMLAFLVANAVMLYLLVHHCVGLRAAALAALAYLSLPVVLAYGHLTHFLQAAVFGMLLFLYCYIRATEGERLRGGWALAALVAMALAFATSWEPILVLPALFVLGLWRWRNQEVFLAAAGGVVVVAVVLGTFGLYKQQAGDHTAPFARFFAKFHYYGGAQAKALPFDVHGLVENRTLAERPPTRLCTRATIFATRADLTGNLANAAVLAVLVAGLLQRRRLRHDRHTLLFLALLSPWVLAYLLMTEYCAIHHFETLIAAPAAAVAVALAAGSVLAAAHKADDQRFRRGARWAVTLALPLALLVPIAVRTQKLVQASPEVTDDIRFARELRDATGQDAIVLMPHYDFVPLWYSHRHILRGVRAPELLEKTLEHLPQAFPDVETVYLALRPYEGEPETFPEIVKQHPVVRRTEHLLLVAVPVPDEPAPEQEPETQ
jgi:hypothetical protein